MYNHLRRLSCQCFLKYSKGTLIFSIFQSQFHIILLIIFIFDMNLNCISRVLFAIVFSLLQTEISPLMTMTYNYDNTANSLFRTCTFPLGSVPRETSLKIVVTLWNSLTNNFVIDIKNSADNSILHTHTCTVSNICETIYYTGAASLQYNFRVRPVA
jgi:hypothetical protein